MPQKISPTSANELAKDNMHLFNLQSPGYSILANFLFEWILWLVIICKCLSCKYFVYWTRKKGVCSGNIQQHRSYNTVKSWFKDSRPTYTSWFEKGAVGGAEETWRRSLVLTPRHVCWAQNNFNRLHVCRRLVRQTKLLPLHLYGAVRGDACFLHELQLILVYCSCSLFQLLEKQQRRIFLPQEPRHLLI